MSKTLFEWDSNKDLINLKKHGIGFADAQYAFADPQRVIAEDTAHSKTESRYFCFGIVNGDIVTVRFTYRNNTIRIIGAGHWRKGKAIYEQKNQIQQ